MNSVVLYENKMQDEINLYSPFPLLNQVLMKMGKGALFDW